VSLKIIVHEMSSSRLSKRSRRVDVMRPRKRMGKSSKRRPQMGATSGLTGYSKRPECNSVDTTFNIAADTAPVLALTNGVAAGTNFYQRIGARIKMKSLHVTGFLAPDGTNSVERKTPTFARLLIVYDRQPGIRGAGVAPVMEDVLRNVTAQGGPSSTYWSGVNMVNRERFKILRDIRRLLPAIGVNNTEATSALCSRQNDPANSNLVNEFIKLGGLEAHYNSAGGGAIDDIIVGAIWIFAVSSDSSAGAPFHWALNCRLRYYDN